MSSECLRIADQLRRAFNGDAWHGPSLHELLSDVTAEQAYAHPVKQAHSIWELVLHIEIYVRIAADATEGVPMPRLFGTDAEWPKPAAEKDAWSNATTRLFAGADRLAKAVETFSDVRLRERAPGRDEYDFYFLFHGIVQHSLYHGGQIALLKKAF